ncbi:MAG TPA: rhodanese-like domain-containing protein [Ignavibacteriaceae bacterium]|nr:rhodanese-like domain-containing protein [Ignavibacteriaceae bacterium]
MKRMVGFIAAILFLLNPGLPAQSDLTVKNISVNEFKQQIEGDSNLVILDVRTPEELTGPLGKIDGVINIPVQQLDKRIDELNNYKDQEIAVICRTGHRSAIAAKILSANGFTKVENVEGGMTAYRQDQKIIKRQKTEKQIHDND